MIAALLGERAHAIGALLARLAGHQIAIRVRERWVRTAFPRFFDDRSGAFGFAFTDQQARSHRACRREGRRHAEGFLGHVGSLIGAALAFELRGLRRHQHGAAALGDLVFDLFALVAEIERFERIFPIRRLHGEVERVLEWPGCCL